MFPQPFNAEASQERAVPSLFSFPSALSSAPAPQAFTPPPIFNFGPAQPTLRMPPMQPAPHAPPPSGATPPSASSVPAPQGGASLTQGVLTLVPRTNPATWTVDTLVTTARAEDLPLNNVKKFVIARCKALNDEGGDSNQMMVTFHKDMELAIQQTPQHLQSKVQAEVGEAMEDLRQELRLTSTIAKTAALRNKTVADQVKVSTSKAKLQQVTLIKDDALIKVEKLGEQILANRRRDAEKQEAKRARHDATVALTKEKTRTTELKKEVQVEQNRTWYQKTQDTIKNATEWAEKMLARDEDPAEEEDGGAGDGAAGPPPGSVDAAGPGGPP